MGYLQQNSADSENKRQMVCQDLQPRDRIPIAFWGFSIVFVVLCMVLTAGAAQAQNADCDRIRAQIAAIDPSTNRPNSYESAAQRQQAEIDKTAAYAQSLGCDRGGFSFFGSQPPAQCSGLNARIRAMQANLAQLQGIAARTGGGGAAQRQDLVARYNTYCRSQQRGFFESLFGGGSSLPAQSDLPEDSLAPTDDDQTPKGGSQAICVRSCDGGFFPLNYSVRHEGLDELCHALCPNTDVAVYSRSPDNDVGTAVSIDGRPYRDLQNAFKFQKSFDPSCTCKAKGESWVQALTQSDAERVLGQERKGDIIVTPEQSAKMSQPKNDVIVRTKLTPADQNQDFTNRPASVSAQSSAPKSSTLPNATEANAASADQSGTEEVTGPDGIKRRVRRVGPTP